MKLPLLLSNMMTNGQQKRPMVTRQTLLALARSGLIQTHARSPGATRRRGGGGLEGFPNRTWGVPVPQGEVFNKRGPRGN